MTGPHLLAHGVGQVYESPIPLWLYLVGAGATVAVSFVVRAVARDVPRTLTETRIASPGTAKLIRTALSVAGLIGLALMLVGGVVVRDEGFTTATLTFWLGLIIGMVLLSAIIDGTWEAADPWASLENGYRIEGVEVTERAAPWWLGPLLVYALFWFELISGVGFEDLYIVIAVVAYSLFAFSLRATLGNSWRTTDPLSILFGFAGRIAPFRISTTGIYRRSPLFGIDDEDPIPLGIYLALFVTLASTTLDNIRETVGWTNFMKSTGLDALSSQVVDSIALLVFAGLFLVPFLIATATARRWRPGEPLMTVSRAFGWSLIPIGVAYILAHNAPLIMTGVPAMLRLLSDPFELGWNVFGTARLFSGFAPSPKLVWFIEIAIIVGGHILGVLSAHRTAVRMAPSHGAAVKSQYALTGLMTLYTVATLALLAQPLVG